LRKQTNKQTKNLFSTVVGNKGLGHDSSGRVTGKKEQGPEFKPHYLKKKKKKGIK
jgi:hypothetical protein